MARCDEIGADAQPQTSQNALPPHQLVASTPVLRKHLWRTTSIYDIPSRHIMCLLVCGPLQVPKNIRQRLALQKPDSCMRKCRKCEVTVATLYLKGVRDMGLGESQDVETRCAQFPKLFPHTRVLYSTDSLTPANTFCTAALHRSPENIARAPAATGGVRNWSPPSAHASVVYLAGRLHLVQDIG